MGAPSGPEVEPLLSDLYAECMRLFQDFLLALNDENCRVVHLEQVHLASILDEYGRATIWGDQSKAELPDRARGSLDDTLRPDDELRSLVRAIFMRLSSILRQATSIANRKHDPDAESDQDPASALSAESGSDADDDDDEHSDLRKPKICLLVSQMTEQIRSLYDLSSLLRRPRIEDKHIRSVKSKEKVEVSGDTAELLLIEGYAIEKLLQWHGTKSGQGIDFQIKDIAPTFHGLTIDYIEHNQWYRERLARANTRRREQIQYWMAHPYDSGQEKERASPSVAREEPNADELRNQASSIKAKQPELELTRAGSMSKTSKQSFSTSTLSNIDNSLSSLEPSTVYAHTKIGQVQFNSVPNPPKTKNGKTTFPCPYCGMTLKSEEMQNRQSWERHVFRDLRPYVCTFKDCQNSEKLYESRHDWICHENQVHRRRYVCKECTETSLSRKDMAVHLRKHYGESISAAHLGVMLDLCNRQIDDVDDEKHSCLMCGREFSLSRLQSHLAGHMEDIALFVLQDTDEDEESLCSKASSEVGKMKLRGKAVETKSEMSGLDLSTTRDGEQSSAESFELTSSEEGGYASNIADLGMADEDHPLSMSRTATPQLIDPDPAFVSAMKALMGEPALPGENIETVLRRSHGPIEGLKQDVVAVLASPLALPADNSRGIQDSLEDRGSDGLTALSRAAARGHYGTVKQLLEKGADFQTKDAKGDTPLALAAQRSHESIVQLLLSCGADPHKENVFGDTPLSLAAKRGCTSVVKILLDCGADPQTQNASGATPLYLAVSRGHTVIIQLLLSSGADPQKANVFGDTPLALATKKNQTNVIKLLLEHGARPQKDDTFGTTPLGLTAKRGHRSITKSKTAMQEDVQSPDRKT